MLKLKNLFGLLAAVCLLVACEKSDLQKMQELETNSETPSLFSNFVQPNSTQPSPLFVQNGGNSCEAENMFGGSCSADCPNDQTPVCKSGLFTVSCTCEGGDTSDDTDTIVSGMDVEIANNFIPFVQGIGSPTTNSLADNTQQALNAGLANDIVGYEDARQAMQNDLDMLTPSEEQMIDAWLVQNGVTIK